MVGNDAVNKWDLLGNAWPGVEQRGYGANNYPSPSWHMGNINVLYGQIKREGRVGPKCDVCKLEKVRNLKMRALYESIRWNRRSMVWAFQVNECAQQAHALSEYLVRNIKPELDRFIDSSGREVIPWSYGVDGGNIITGGKYIIGFNNFGNHNVVRVNALEDAKDCQMVDYYIDSFKGNGVFQFANPDGYVGTGTWTSFKSYYPGDPG